jgi:hypothetical protein
MHDAVPAIAALGVSPIVRIPDVQSWMVKRKKFDMIPDREWQKADYILQEHWIAGLMELVIHNAMLEDIWLTQSRSLCR